MALRRRYDQEIMDDFSITDGRISHALDELRTINIFLGGSSTSRKGVRDVLRSAVRHGGNGTAATHGRPVTVLDVGAGGSDHPYRRAAIGHEIEIISVDINIGVCRYIQEHEPSRAVVCADAMALPFGPNSVDVVHASLFLHHFTEDEIERLLIAFLGIARYGVVINDLQRSSLALAGIRLLTRLFSNSAMVINDAPLSVKRGFIRREMLSMLRGLPCSSYTLHWRWAFRWLAVIQK